MPYPPQRRWADEPYVPLTRNGRMTARIIAELRELLQRMSCDDDVGEDYHSLRNILTHNAPSVLDAAEAHMNGTMSFDRALADEVAEQAARADGAEQDIGKMGAEMVRLELEGRGLLHPDAARLALAEKALEDIADIAGLSTVGTDLAHVDDIIGLWQQARGEEFEDHPECTCDSVGAGIDPRCSKHGGY
ncbi:hypothetical protein LCGC14_1369910 [marine sediment metagenome]|uniref:Uncharacterized protein n=1 Tax=marine sediment metagenome TaxID=412755 RepID=A0A0F9N7M1_9ZZZZ